MATLVVNPTSGAANRLYYGGSESWAASRDSAVAEGIQTNGIVQGSFGGGTSWPIARIAEVFNTAALPDNATVTAVTLQIYVTALTNTDTSTIDLVSFAPTDSSSVVVADYAKAKWGETPYADIALASLNLNAYNIFTLNATGIAAISKTGNSVFGLRISRDTDNSQPTGGNDVTFQTNNGVHPEILTITYTTPSGGAFLLNMI